MTKCYVMPSYSEERLCILNSVTVTVDIAFTFSLFSKLHIRIALQARYSDEESKLITT